jgi:hypothetical protein
VDIFIIVWSGGDEPPQYEIRPTEKAAWQLALTWEVDAQDNFDESEYWIDVIKINTSSPLNIERLKWPPAREIMEYVDG